MNLPLSDWLFALRLLAWSRSIPYRPKTRVDDDQGVHAPVAQTPPHPARKPANDFRGAARMAVESPSEPE